MQGDDDDDELGLSLETLRALQQHLQHTMQDSKADGASLEEMDRRLREGTLQNLFVASDGDDSDQEGDEEVTVSYAELGGDDSTFIRLSLAPNDGRVRSTLFAHQLWNGAKVLASYLRERSSTVRGARVIEFGAGAALPSVVANLNGAAFVLATDYPSDALLYVMRKNVATNCPVGVDAKRIDVAGHLWGDTVTPLLQVGHNTLTGPTTSLFDIAICSECIWCHDQHDRLLASISNCLREGGVAWVTFSHHVPGKESDDLSFFEKAMAHGLSHAHVRTTQVPHMFRSERMVDMYLYELTKT